MDFLECDNMKSCRGFFALVMVRGRRRVLVGMFPYQQRASSVAAGLNWDGFHSEITKIDTLEEFVAPRA